MEVKSRREGKEQCMTAQEWGEGGGTGGGEGGY